MAAKSKMCVNFQSCCSHISQYENFLDDTVPQPPKKKTMRFAALKNNEDTSVN